MITIRFTHQAASLGRHVEHDPRSRAYALDPVVAHLTPASVAWPVHCDVLDQRDIGACVGFATDEMLATGPNYDALSSGQRQAVLRPDAGFAFYSAATMSDDVPGTWYVDGSGTDTGSTGLGGAKAAKNGGYIAGYLHAFSMAALTKGLQVGPVMVGVNWYESMFTPTASGEVRIAKGSTIAGGHEFLIYGVDVSGSTVTYLAQNSWGRSWGKSGRFTLASATLERLLGEQGDVTQFVPLAAPAPTPTPTPTPTPPVQPTADDLQVWAAMKTWAAAKGMA